MRLITIALLLAASGFAASPNFEGNWKLNGAKSDFGQFPAPSLFTQKITHADPKLTVVVKIVGDQGEFEFTSNFTTDGKECTNPGFGGSETKSTLKWEGDSLIVETKGAFGDNAYIMKDKWALTEQGKVLTVLRHFSSGMGEMDQKLVFEKQ
jgi:hypothetical protein